MDGAPPAPLTSADGRLTTHLTVNGRQVTLTLSCLLFACQLEGADVLTIECLGRPRELHPLQQAFGCHHALQCGSARPVSFSAPTTCSPTNPR
jgi:aerobic-type carbon monoxide dehydrogenase small subunit (CoxS/CutS family)